MPFFKQAMLIPSLLLVERQLSSTIKQNHRCWSHHHHYSFDKVVIGTQGNIRVLWHSHWLHHTIHAGSKMNYCQSFCNWEIQVMKYVQVWYDWFYHDPSTILSYKESKLYIQKRQICNTRPYIISMWNWRIEFEWIRLFRQKSSTFLCLSKLQHKVCTIINMYIENLR